MIPMSTSTKLYALIEQVPESVIRKRIRMYNRIATIAKVILKAEKTSTKVIVKRGVQLTCFRPKKNQIQFGTKHKSARSYIVEDGKIFSVKRPPSIIVHTSTILEEVAHAVNHKRGYNDKHGHNFYKTFVELWNKHALKIASNLEGYV